VAVPDATPFTTPEVLTVASVVVELLHTPPVVASVNVVVLPTQTDLVPPIAAGAEGNAYTVTVVVLVQPPLFLKVITLVPATTPFTRPVLLIVATVVFADTQGVVVAAVPDPVNWVVNPAQTVNVPVIVGIALTVTVAVLVHPPLFL